jgi:ubiquinone/menaquinone biosynthesis C-methylase UbiE
MKYQTNNNNSSFFKKSPSPRLGSRSRCKLFRKKIAPENHEKKVESFYSTGINPERLNLKKIEKIDRGFLSFGYWEKETKSYLEAATNLVRFIIKKDKTKKSGKILNVACGYGAETFIFYDHFKPKLIEGIEITKIHVTIANNKADELGLSDKISFKYGDACKLNYPAESFSYILGIEGPAHFNPREKFFTAALQVLEKKGELLITDIILGKKFDRSNKLRMLILKCVAKLWVYPKANWVDEQGYKKQLEKAGLKLISLETMGNKVFPGFADNCFKLKTIITRSAHRGLFSIIGLNIISFLLSYVYKKGLIEYIFVRAQKP